MVSDEEEVGSKMEAATEVIQEIGCTQKVKEGLHWWCEGSERRAKNSKGLRRVGVPKSQDLGRYVGAWG